MQKIRIDFDNPGLPQHISAVENDSQSRFFQATLYENGKAYTAPEGAAYSIMYRGFGPQNQGWYDTINDGAGKRAACAVSGNVVTCEIARQALQVPGHVSIVLCVTTGKGYMLKSWPIECDCKNDRYDSTVEIQSFFYITQVSNESWTQAIQAVEELKNTIDPTLSLSGKAADAAKVGEAINAETTRAKAAEEENAKGIGQLKEDLGDTNSILEENLVRISANLINPDNMLENTAITISNRISTSSNTTYKSYLNIPVKAGESYYIGNSHRVSCVIDNAENKLVLQSNTQNKTDPFIFNVEKSGLLCVCFYMTEEKPWVALAEKETEYEEYGSKLLQEWLKLQIEKYGYLNPLKGKTIYNFGDSISNGQGNLVGDKLLGPAELVALDNDMVCTDFAVSGSTMSTAGGGNYILKRITDAISASPITPDFVLLAGGINDLKVTSVGDFSEPSSNDDFGEKYISLLDTSNFSGAFETAIYRILNAWPGTQLIYMTEHKMPSHYNDGTETLYQTAKKICKKWCVPILDMWNSGGLNMSVLANNKAYGTGDVNLDGTHPDTTHPNGEAYRLYYVPKLKSKLLECCPKTN